MKISVPKEIAEHEKRVPLIPKNVEELAAKGFEIEIESGLGNSIGISDSEYQGENVNIIKERKAIFENADLIVRVQKSLLQEVKWMKRNAIHISYLDPFNEIELISLMTSKYIRAISMEMIPRTTKAQKMDVLSSQASLSGYSAVLLAAERLQKIFPMMMTPAGTISPSRVFIIGAGVCWIAGNCHGQEVGG